MAVYSTGIHRIWLQNGSDITAMGDAELHGKCNDPNAQITINAFDNADVTINGVCGSLVVRKASHMAEVDANDLQASLIQIVEACGASKVRVQHTNARINQISGTAVVVVDGYGVAEIVQDRGRLLVTSVGGDERS